MNVCHKPMISCFAVVSLFAINAMAVADSADDIRLRVQKVGKLNISQSAAAPAVSDTTAASTEAPAAETKASTESPAIMNTDDAPTTESTSETQVSAAPAAVSSDSDAGNDVAQLYQASCFACHGTGVLEAPKLGDKAAWEPRIAQGNDVIMEHVIKGFNAMPPRGATTLDDETLAQLVAYMINSVQ